jgi:hypothetical protein
MTISATWRKTRNRANARGRVVEIIGRTPFANRSSSRQRAASGSVRPEMT